MNRRRTYKRDYSDLYANPLALFPPTATSAGVKTILHFRESLGMPCIVFRDPTTGRGFKVEASSGPAGFSVRVETIFTERASVLVYGDPCFVQFSAHDEVKEVTLTQYNSDARSQAFKRWYRHEETEADIAVLGETYRRRKPETGPETVF